MLNEITHQNLSQPDHILLGKDFGLPFYATSYKNMYSDHNSISFRFANSETEKLLPSLKQQVQENYVRRECDSAGDRFSINTFSEWKRRGVDAVFDD